jgi:hypothetical protein
MVFKWLKGDKHDHPLADEKGAKEILGALPASDPVQCIKEIRDWIESVSTADDLRPDKRAEIIRLLDETAQTHQRKLARDYVSNPHLPRAQEVRLWTALFGLWKDLAAAYPQCLQQVVADADGARRMKPLLALTLARAVQAIAMQLKWHYMHYQRAEAGVWENLGKVYRLAETQKLGRDSVSLYQGAPATSTEREFAKALVLAASSPDSLRPLDIDLAERIVAHFSAEFLLSEAHQPRVTYYMIDLASGAPPRRLIEAPPASGSLRFFSPGAAEGQLGDLIRVAERGGVPSSLNLGGAAESARVLGVLRHLKNYWAAIPPVRAHDRYEIDHRINIVNGFDSVLAKVNGSAGAAPDPAAGAETWVAANISAGGMSAVGTKVQGDWLRVGQLVGVQVDGGSGACAVGLIRRCSHISREITSVGIHTLAKEAHAIELTGAAAGAALLLKDVGEVKDEVLLCLSGGAYDSRVSPSMSFEQQTYLLMPVELAESGDDYELARFRAVRKS